ncbi:hypothetical protein GPJ56_008823 [Histomonas meleagridis]|uniref:uncharacterized protein n=1 Tax=Histomonas meleagridis TaxID=135588 RepID=UPI003559F52F|nr:hypothetical protein GPJ56_008823 [Histomonas meleagridis]KAH0805386.1 hypothetical protein GO595_001768 [Histomonas meleagridis]
MAELRPIEEEEEEQPELVEEEEEQHDLIVVDNEFIENLLNGIKSSNPLSLAQAVDIILGIFGYKNAVALDDDLSENPTLSILTNLIPKLVEIYDSSKEGSVKKQKVTDLLEKLAAAIFDSFDKFKKEKPLFKIFCNALGTMIQHADPDVYKKAFTNATKVGLLKQSYNNIIFKLFEKTVLEEQLQSMTIRNIYLQLSSYANANLVESLLPRVADFYIQFNEQSCPFIKNLIQKLAAETIDALQQTSKTFISWSLYTTVELITSYIIGTQDRRFIHPFITTVLPLLKNFPIKLYLPFQIRICLLIHTISQEFDVFVPLLSWMAEAIQFVCTVSCKGDVKFKWNDEILSPQTFSVEFCHEALERIKKLFFSHLMLQGTSIAFPEFIHSIRVKLESVLHSQQKNQIANELRPLIKIITKQQQALLEIKRGLNWEQRNEQLANWKREIALVDLPLQSFVNREAKVEETLKQMNATKTEKPLEEYKDDELTVATVDDV